MSAYGPFELAPLEAVIVPDIPTGNGTTPTLESIREQSYEEGFAAGIAQAQSQLDGPAAALAGAAEQLQAMRADAAASVEADAVDLALRIAEQVVQASLAVEPERVVDAVRGALRRLVERDRVLVLVHPDDLDVLREHADGLVAELGGIEHIGVEADRRVARGGAIVRTSEGEVDATLETKLGRAREVVEQDLARD